MIRIEKGIGYDEDDDLDSETRDEYEDMYGDKELHYCDECGKEICGCNLPVEYYDKKNNLMLCEDCFNEYSKEHKCNVKHLSGYYWLVRFETIKEEE